MSTFTGWVGIVFSVIGLLGMTFSVVIKLGTNLDGTDTGFLGVAFAIGGAIMIGISLVLLKLENIQHELRKLRVESSN